MFNTIAQDQILWNLRPEIPSIRMNRTGLTADEIEIEIQEQGEEEEEEGGIKKYYVDADHMSSFLNAAAEGLGLENAYNFFILNPTSSVNQNEMYGYRRGFSQAEIDELVHVWRNEVEDELSLFEILAVDEFPCDNEEPPVIPHLVVSDFTAGRVQVIDYTEKSTEWSNWFLREEKNARRASLLSNDRDDPSLLFTFARSESKSVIELAEKVFTPLF